MKIFSICCQCPHLTVKNQLFNADRALPYEMPGCKKKLTLYLCELTKKGRIFQQKDKFSHMPITPECPYQLEHHVLSQSEESIEELKRQNKHQNE